MSNARKYLVCDLYVILLILPSSDLDIEFCFLCRKTENISKLLEIISLWGLPSFFIQQ